MAALESDDLLIDVSEGIGTLCLNRPSVRNVLDPEYLRRMIAAVRGFDDDPSVRVLVLRGNGKSFCAGGSREFLISLSRMDDTGIRTSVYEGFQGITRALYQCKKPVVAAMQGAVIGAACEMAAACDFRIAAEDAFFSENWIDLGLMPPLGGLFLLPRLVGLGKATEMVMTGERVPAVDALRLGLVNRVVKGEDLLKETRALATLLCGKSMDALRVIKQGLRRGVESTMGNEWEFNIHAQTGLLRGKDFRNFVESLERMKA